jgi:3-hydroxyisobutyrate dehydrogenase
VTNIPMTFEVASPEKTAIGWIGTGVMGQSMAGHLLSAGYRLTVYNRSLEKAKALIDRGATYAASPEEVASRSDVVFTMVGYPRDVRQVILGDETQKGIIHALRPIHDLRPSAIVVDMTTSQPSLAVELAERMAEVGVASLDAPVSGGDIGARNAALSIMVGGSREAFEAVLPLFHCLGKTIVHQGGPGTGQHTKMVNQTLVAASMIGVCEALLYAEAAGLDAASMLKSVSSGAATSWTLVNLAPKIIANDFAPGFYVEHFIKDMRIALDEASRMQIALPGLSLVSQLYAAVAAHGHARSGTQALALALKALSNR